MDAPAPTAPPDHSAWTRNVEAPLREFLHTETGGAAILLAATIAALVWANISDVSYERVWHTVTSVHVGSGGVALPLRDWINSGLMALFFFVVGLEARREFDLGELRDRSRVTLPLLAGIGGMAVPVAIFLAFTAGTPEAHGWGIAMSTDTAFALGILAIVGPRFPERLRKFLLTLVVVDDLVALIVIAAAYTGSVSVTPLIVAVGFFAIAIVLRALNFRRGMVYGAVGLAAWVAVLKSGVDPVVVGLALGLLTLAYPASRSDLEAATEQFRQFREQPTAELARSARTVMDAALSPNDRMQQLWHPWTSYVIVPLFALANAGIALDGHFLRHAIGSPVTLGVLVGYVVGKPLGIVATSLLITIATRGKRRPPVGWAAVFGGGSVAGIGFTVALLIAGLAFTGDTLKEAKLGILASAVLAPIIAWLVFRATAALPTRLRIRFLMSNVEAIVDLQVEVDPDRDHIRGPHESPVTLVEYGDLECPFCGRAEPTIRELLQDFGDLRYVWRHLPLADVHPNAQLAAEASEAAGAQGKFWEMHDLLFGHQDELEPRDLLRHAESLGLDMDRFSHALKSRKYASRVAEDVDGADLSGVSGTPSFFINGVRHHGAYDLASLTEAIRAARARSMLRA